MSNFRDDSDSEVDRIMMDRPSSSYGSMHSDDHEGEEDDEFEEHLLKLPATRVRLHRSDSPETQMVECLSQLHPEEIAYFKRSLSTHCRFRKNYSRIADLNDPLDLADKMIEVCGLGEALHLTIRAIQNVGKDNLAEYLRKTCRRGKAASHFTKKFIGIQLTKAPLDALLTSLIKGTLLPNARVWITSHVTAAHRIPPQLIDRYVELRGFTDEKKEEYFTKRTTDPELGRKVYNHMKRSKALEIICHLPLFSWMVAFIFERGFRDPEYGKHPPGITAFFSQLIIVQMNRSFEKYRGCNVEDQKWRDEDNRFIYMMGKMSYRMIQEGRDWFTVEDLTSVNLTYEDLRSRDELTTEVKRKNEDIHTWVFKFVHITVQEYMAAMYAYVAFRKHGKNVIEPSKMSWFQGPNKDRPVIELYRPAIDRALASPNGHLDMFLRFLVGLVTPGTEDNLRGYLLGHYHPKAKGTEEVVKYINKKMRDNIHPDRRRNLELCLVELEEGKE
ncbi:protein NLRC3-like [Sinocyclocheilus rhinocerous]|uniref:protein NLRC3-like n=1 Tax=Sinocyclocheilus rhinocerous TaxID=307959 RepID=UPI0007B8B9CD|nr:PREDICTED: protein NLRC3-like [Sinocyclocheilus rhinocerous]